MVVKPNCLHPHNRVPLYNALRCIFSKTILHRRVVARVQPRSVEFKTLSAAGQEKRNADAPGGVTLLSLLGRAPEGATATAIC